MASGIKKTGTVLTLLFTAGALNSSTDDNFLKGYAYEFDGRSLIYTENHYLNYSNGRHISSRVNYKSPEGRLLVQKNISFRKDRVTPDFRSVDMRTGYIEGVEKISGNLYRVFTREKKGEAMREKKIRIPGRVIVDGGFDYFIKNNWQALNSRKKLQVSFVVPSRLDYFTFNIYKVRNRSFKGVDAVEYTMKVDATLLKMFVEPITVVYSANRRELLYYTGLSNIRDEDGDNLNARILFRENVKEAGGS